MTTQHLTKDLIHKINLFTRLAVSSCLGSSQHITMSPLILSLLIVTVLGDDSAESGEHHHHHCDHITVVTTSLL